MEKNAKKTITFHHVKDQIDCLWAKFQNSWEVAGYIQHDTHVTHVTDFMLYFAVDVFVCFNKNVEKEFSLFSYSLRWLKST